jgi:hypothetical protein
VVVSNVVFNPAYIGATNTFRVGSAIIAIGVIIIGCVVTSPSELGHKLKLERRPKRAPDFFMQQEREAT